MLTKLKVPAHVNKMYKLACDARKKAYAPYSKFKVGAAILSNDGKIYSGCNVEIATYRSICAEQTAIVKGIASGSKKFKEVVVVLNGPTPTPCGSCRQMLVEFCAASTKIWAASPTKGIQHCYTLGELLPHNFSLK